MDGATDSHADENGMSFFRAHGLCDLQPGLVGLTPGFAGALKAWSIMVDGLLHDGFTVMDDCFHFVDKRMSFHGGVC
ncbi:hypothetical protein KDA_46860 [Dictyobacter alpinus]|uniref:Uncharacterized protein n=1 Tax=Dictyobacter alpinus TaxID=2014873 RepID=A0A402BD49_9CHLR|nr:hypothetical protein KDA_46860 [Dictyobacter alpinus]